MGRLKHKLLFYGLSLSAYFSPIVMIISMLTNYWLYSVEKITGFPHSPTLQTSSIRPTSLVSNPLINFSNTKYVQTIASMSTESTIMKHNEPLGYIEASYGLWQICKVTGKFELYIDKKIQNY